MGLIGNFGVFNTSNYLKKFVDYVRRKSSGKWWVYSIVKDIIKGLLGFVPSRSIDLKDTLGESRFL